jgi:predicted Zn-ribbon and HTH transcriptional regulator
MKTRPKKPAVPLLQEDTIRHAIMTLLAGEPVTALDISREVRIPEREVAGHLEHIRKTLRTTGLRLQVVPAVCGVCGFVFHKRTRLTKPGKCPVCRSSHISEPLFSLGGEEAYDR